VHRAHEHLRSGRRNGEPAIVTRVSGRVLSTTSIEADGDRIVAAYRILNPDKLRHVDEGHPSSGRAAE
jgi:hypothetical protein